MQRPLLERAAKQVVSKQIMSDKLSWRARSFFFLRHSVGVRARAPGASIRHVMSAKDGFCVVTVEIGTFHTSQLNPLAAGFTIRINGFFLG